MTELKEIWKTIPGTNSFYQASTLGRIRSVDRTIQRHRSCGLVSYRMKGQILKLIPARTYYGVEIRGWNCKLALVHRLVALTFHGPCPDGRECAHLNGNGHDNRPDNLIWATPKENNSHKKLHGTAQIGEKNARAKITEVQAREIQRRFSDGERCPSIAKDYGILPGTVWAIGKKRIWKHLGGEPPKALAKGEEHQEDPQTRSIRTERSIRGE